MIRAPKALNPGVIYCSVSGFGQTGEMRDVAAIDQIVQSLSGLMKLSGNEGDPAMRIGFPIVDTYSGLLAAFAIQTAIIQKERGLIESQNVDVAMLDATLVMLSSVVNPLLMAGQQHVRTGNRGFSRSPTADTFACKTGEITVGAVEDHHIAKMLDVLGVAHLLDDPRFATRIDRLRLAMLQVALAEYAADGIALHPVDWAAIELTKDSQNQYLIANPRAIAGPTLWGLPVAATQAFNAGEYTVGAWQQGAQGWDREDAKLIVSLEDRDNVIKNMVTMLVEERLSLTVYRPESFVKGTFADLATSSGS